MKKSVFYSILTVILAGVILIACGVGSSWFTNGDFKTWFNSWGQGQKTPDTGDKPDNPDNPDIGDTADIFNGGLTMPDEVLGDGVSLMSAYIPADYYEAYGIDTYADTAYQLSATIEPADADNKLVDYSIAWVNPDSGWASGKNISDYLVIAQSSDGALTATLTCKQAFGAQALVTVVARASAGVKATATVDYRKRLTSTTTGIFDGNTNSTKTWNKENDLYNASTTFTDNFGVGTLDDTVKSHTMTITTHTTLRNQLASVFTSSANCTSYTATREYDGKSKYSAMGTLNWYALFEPLGGHSSGVGNTEGLFSFCSGMVDYGEWDIVSSKYNKLRTCLINSSVDFVVTVKTTLEHGGTHSYTYNVNVLDSSLSILPSSVTMGNNSIVF